MQNQQDNAELLNNLKSLLDSISNPESENFLNNLNIAHGIKSEKYIN